jgi:hypothetical protein
MESTAKREQNMIVSVGISGGVRNLLDRSA